MLIQKLLLGLSATMVLCGCATVSFAPPARTHGTEPTSSPVTLAQAVDWASSRKKDYDAAADQVANSPQGWDLPLIGAGLVGVSQAAFGWSDNIAKGAGIFALGDTTTRNYYKFGPRHSALIGASSALGCVRRVGQGLRAVDEQPWVEGVKHAYKADDDYAKQVRRIGAIALRAAADLRYNVDEIDTAARRRLATAQPPDISAFGQQYQTLLKGLSAQQEQNQAVHGLTPKVMTRTVTDDKGIVRTETVSPPEGYESLLADPILNDALVRLDTDLTACRILAG